MNIQLLILGLVGFVFLMMAIRAVRSRSVVHYGPAEVHEQMRRQGGVLLLDVRTRRERDARHIPGSLHIPLHELRKRAEELHPHRGREIVCYCQSGNRSVTAALLLKKQGFRTASMRGGIVDWDVAAHGGKG